MGLPSESVSVVTMDSVGVVGVVTVLTVTGVVTVSAAVEAMLEVITDSDPEGVPTRPEQNFMAADWALWSSWESHSVVKHWAEDFMISSMELQRHSKSVMLLQPASGAAVLRHLRAHSGMSGRDWALTTPAARARIAANLYIVTVVDVYWWGWIR